MKFCNTCGSGKMQFRVPEGDTTPRFICDTCDIIHYENPKLVVGCIPTLDGEVLLCKRAIEPRYGYWTLPAGFMENGESTEEGAVRETREEANAELTGDLTLFSIYSIPSINQVHVFFKANLKNRNFSSGPESLDVRLYSPQNIPWDNLSFATVKKTLRHFCDEIPGQTSQVHIGTIETSIRKSKP